MPHHPVREIWKYTCILWQAHYEKGPDCHWALCYSPDICMWIIVVCHSTQCSIKEGFLATKTIWLCSQRKNIRLAENPDPSSESGLPSRYMLCLWHALPMIGSPPGHWMASIPQGWVLGVAPPPMQEESLRQGGVGSPEGIAPEGPAALSLAQSNLRAQTPWPNFWPFCTFSDSEATSHLCF